MKITIIIPVYNASKYIEQGIKKILNQTHKNTQIILIDDCSTDNSFELISKQSDSRVTVLKNATNRGAGETRNEGLKIATGKYVYFFDADDDIDIDYIEKLALEMESKNSDLVVGPFYHDNKVVNYKNKKIINDKMRRQIFLTYNKSVLCTLWNKMYRLSVIKDNNIKFEDFRTGQDLIFNIEYSKYIDSLDMIDIQSYYYYRNETEHSITKNFNNGIIDAHINRFFYFKEFNQNILIFKRIRLYNEYSSCKKKILKANISKKDKSKYILLLNTKIGKVKSFKHFFLILISFKLSIRYKIYIIIEDIIKLKMRNIKNLLF